MKTPAVPNTPWGWCPHNWEPLISSKPHILQIKKQRPKNWIDRFCHLKIELRSDAKPPWPQIHAKLGGFFLLLWYDIYTYFYCKNIRLLNFSIILNYFVALPYTCTWYQSPECLPAPPQAVVRGLWTHITIPRITHAVLDWFCFIHFKLCLNSHVSLEWITGLINQAMCEK